MSNFDIRIKELEFKYLGDNIKIKDFLDLAQKYPRVSYKEVGSWDFYYSGNHYDFPFEFMRFRQGEDPQLTIKIRTNDKNNNNRDEINIPLDPETPNEELELIVSKFCAQLKFKENFRIYKYCRIFYYEKTDLVYYIVYDENMKERGRFIETECRQDYSFKSFEEAWDVLLESEKKLAELGISANNRTNLSLWDRFKKETK